MKKFEHKKIENNTCKCQFKIASLQIKVQQLISCIGKIMHSLADPHHRNKNFNEQSFQSLLLDGLDSIDNFNRIQLPNYHTKIELLFAQVEGLTKNARILQQIKTNVSMLTKIVDHQQVKLEGLYQNFQIGNFTRKQWQSLQKISIPKNRKKANFNLMSMRDIDDDNQNCMSVFERKQFLSEFDAKKSFCSSEEEEKKFKQIEQATNENPLHLNFSEITLQPQKYRK